MAVGVTTVKKIIPITIGEIILPSKIPNLNHILFNGLNSFELKIPNIKKINDIINDQILISRLFFSGHKATIKKTTKKTIPKLLFELTFIFIDKFILYHNILILKKYIKLY